MTNAQHGENDPGKRRSRILLAIDREANREQLAAWLSGEYAVEPVGDRPMQQALGECDLCLVDGALFSGVRGALAAGKDAADPVFLPSLLILTDGTPSDVGESTWAVIDDVIEVPIRQAELRGRIEVLLRARRYSVELKRQNDRLERFADIVSHDLRNPLTIAQGFLGFARETGDEDDFDRVDDALGRMEAIIEDVLSLARTGTVVEETEPIELAEVAETAWRTVSTGGATLDVELDEGVSLHGEETRVIGLFENLFRNSVEHGSTGSAAEPHDSVEHSSTGSRTESGDSGEHGSTSGRPAADDAAERATDPTVSVGALANGEGFYVEDDGPGIPEDERERVFEYGHTTADDGTGFGLAIVQGIVDAHGWSIQVTEGRHGGARFEITCDLQAGSRPSRADADGDGGSSTE